ncbi:hypothetical protein HaLaN_02316 [Haematococcus lacustris]|uniref:Uncharacterized protein n=1 Tax=Haematococcus lacustris TaxID=44745 RepID=A0A699YDP9_HAELA|nr:hypothetical protein HaLaN_02316 [Haematococcus lacustris]
MCVTWRHTHQKAELKWALGTLSVAFTTAISQPVFDYNSCFILVLHEGCRDLNLLVLFVSTLTLRPVPPIDQEFTNRDAQISTARTCIVLNAMDSKMTVAGKWTRLGWEVRNIRWRRDHLAISIGCAASRPGRSRPCPSYRSHPVELHAPVGTAH